MRVIAGSARGRPLHAPAGRDVRPTSDRVREALFSMLADDIPGADVLDLFAGSGALAIEALSRGAQTATLVERDPRAVQAIKANLAKTGLGERAVVLREDACRFVGDPDPPGPYHVVLCDPPYTLSLSHVYRLLDTLWNAGALARHGVVVVERDRRDPELGHAPPRFLAFDRQRSYGDTVLMVLRATDAS